MEEKQPKENRGKLNIGNMMFSLLCVLSVSLYPALFLYAQNAAEASFSEIAVPAVFFAGAGVVLFALLWLMMRNHMQHAAVIAAVSMLVLLNFAAVEKLMCRIVPETRYWHAVIIVVFLLFNVGLLVVTKLSDEWAGSITRILAGVFGLLIVMNVGIAVPTIAKKISSEKELAAQREQMLAQQVESDEYLPNIYYIILDEYSGFETVKNVLGYDNEPFAQHLEELGFTVSRNSYNEYFNTIVTTADLMDLSYRAIDYIFDETKLNEQRQNGMLFTVLRERGYKIQGVGSESGVLYGLERMDEAAVDAVAETAGGKSLKDLLFDSTAMYPVYKRNILEQQEDILRSFAYMENMENFQEQGVFTLAHIVCPHEPFYFDENGGSVSAENLGNWKDTRYYLGQFKYCTKRASEIVEKLVKHDPNAVIILQSDHGARASSDPDLVGKLITHDEMRNILNAVYMKGEAFDEMQEQSGVNTLRLVCNRLFGLDFELLEVPSFYEN